jgi:hypothetical protein
LCWNTGDIDGSNSGGIVGNNAFLDGKQLNINKCYSTGLINGENSGGLVGSNSGISSTNILITESYTTGNINGNSSGGIIGNFSNFYIANCYTTRNISGVIAGGICGPVYSSSSNILYCYVSGFATTGYFIGNSVFVPDSCYSEAKNGSSGWNSTNANKVLLNIPNPIYGETWSANGYDNPYELSLMGYTPYTIVNIYRDEMNTELKYIFESTIQAGKSTNSAIVQNKNYKILQINQSGTQVLPTPPITIDDKTGTIITQNNTPVGTYQIYIRNDGSYNITIYELTISPIEISTISNYIDILYSFYNKKKRKKTGKRIKKYIDKL